MNFRFESEGTRGLVCRGQLGLVGLDQFDNGRLLFDFGMNLDHQCCFARTAFDEIHRRIDPSAVHV